MESPGQDPPASSPPQVAEEKIDGNDPLLDLDQLEELHDEAERMKALGNKHMAAQEYTRAYNAYSAALQLSPVGPSSHVFLSNRSAALLSLKRYSAAATDARRAVALAPTFGKAHARLGQSLYFLKNYEGAVTAYEDAIHYEPDNPITRTYLEKARSKWQRQKEKAVKRSGGEEVSVLTAESSVQQTVANSVATDPNKAAAVVTTGFRGKSTAIARAVGGGMGANGVPPTTSSSTMNGKKSPTVNEDSPLDASGDYDEDDEFNPDDPDFDEALRIQERANRYLANKNYKFAIEEYTAALFLVPDDVNLSPELHLGRAHALNGSRRHESAQIDSQLAIKIKPTPEAYSTLAKSLFYMKDYDGSITAFESCKELLPQGESLSMFDRAYLQKAETALQDMNANPSSAQSVASAKTISRLGSSAPIPKLKPPKFVSREEALTRTPNMPAMPKQWPQQSPRESKVVKYYGEEREVVFLSEALGIKLNRGPDGIVRVIEVSPAVAGSPIAREGHIEVGDVIREAAGVDIRRPITNIMWGDTVALIKMAPRPIALIVAKESTESIMDERKRAALNALSPTSAAQYFPSNASTEESVKDQIERQEKQAEEELPDEPQDKDVGQSDLDSPVECLTSTSTEGETSEEKQNDECNVETDVKNMEEIVEKPLVEKSLLDEDDEGDAEPTDHVDEKKMEETEEGETEAEPTKESVEQGEEEVGYSDNRGDEFEVLGAEVFFENNKDLVAAYNGWDSLRWMSLSGVRKASVAFSAFRYVEGRGGFLWNSDEYAPRVVAIYEEPNIILILREASCIAELKDLMEMPADANFEERNPLKSHLFVESVIDPKTAKIRLSPLTTPTSFIPNLSSDCPRRRSTFELINPAESIILSAVRHKKNTDVPCYEDREAYLETSEVEYLLTKSICSAQEGVMIGDDYSWKHQIVLGTLHSHVVLGNQKALDKGIHQSLRTKFGQTHLDLAILEASKKKDPRFLHPRIIDATDESGKAAIHYACESRFSSAVISLVTAGADVNIRIEPLLMTPCHISASKLDFKSLDAILGVSQKPNEVDDLGRSPMYLAITEGRSVGKQLNPRALQRCIATMAKYGGQVGELFENRHPVSYLAYMCQPDEMEIVLKYSQYKFPLHITKEDDLGISLGAQYEYPVHSVLISLKHRLQNLTIGGRADIEEIKRECANLDSDVSKTLNVLFCYGFEPNERIEGLTRSFREMGDIMDYVGFCPTQILFASILELSSQRKAIGEELYASLNEMLANILEFMTLHGARVFSDIPPSLRCEDRTKFSSNSNEPGADLTKRSEIQVQANIEISLVVGKEKINEALAMWKTLKPVPPAAKAMLFDSKENIDNSIAPGGSDERNCAICWKKFGLISRKHRCRISRRYICDECSTHRVIVNGIEYRVSDGQFLLAKAEDMKELQRKMDAAVEKERQRKQQGKLKALANRLKKEEDDANRDSLFGGLASKFAEGLGLADDSKDKAETEADSIAGLSAQLDQTRDALNERGAKLGALNDKSDKLVSASQDFAAMAKELEKKSSQGFFSGWT